MGQLGAFFGQQVKRYRETLGLTQAQLADQAGTSEEWVRRIERGAKAPSFDTIEALSKALEVSPARLFAGAVEPGAAAERVSLAAIGLTAEEANWLEEAVRLVIRRPGRK